MRSSPDLIKDALARLGYVAIYALGPKGGGPITVGISASPEDMLKTAQRWNWQELDLHFVVWAPSLDAATRVKKRVEDLLVDQKIRASWYEIKEDILTNYIEMSAHGASIEICDDGERLRRAELVAQKRLGIAGKK